MKVSITFLTLALGAALCPVLAEAQNLFVSDNSSGNIYKFRPDGTRSTFASGLSYPQGLAFDSAGDLFVADGTATSINSRRAE